MICCQVYGRFFVRNIGCFLKIVGQLESYCFIKSVALRLDAEFVKTTIEMEKICGMLNWKYFYF